MASIFASCFSCTEDWGLYFCSPCLSKSAVRVTDVSDIETFSDLYIQGKKLGEGAYSIVKEAQSRKTGGSFAVKIVTRANLEVEDEEALLDEIDILQSLNHINIIKLYDVYCEEFYYYLVTERMRGGELFDRIVEKESYNEKEAKNVCKILFGAIEYCHSQKNCSSRFKA